MGFLDDSKRKFDQKTEQIGDDLDASFERLEERFKQDVKEVKLFWESKMNELKKAFKRFPSLKMEHETPENFVKGEQFEQFALDLFPYKDYILLNRAHDFKTNQIRYVQEDQYYDFRLKHRTSGYEFAIECKYRTEICHDKYEWTYVNKMRRYKKYERENLPQGYYLMMGFGGKPDNPQDIYLIPLSEINSSEMDPSFLKKYKILPNHIRCDGRRIYA